MNTNDIKEKLNDGEGLRFEVIGTTGLGYGKELSVSRDSNASALVKTEAIFLMDLFKINNQQARTRLLGVKNRGEISVGFTARNKDLLSFVRGKLRDIISFGIFGSFRKTIDLSTIESTYPLDTMMVDYLFNFSTPDKINLDAIKGRNDIAEAAMEELLGSIRKVGFATLFFNYKDEKGKDDIEVGAKLLEKLQIAEDIARTDLERYRRGEIEAKDLRVRSFFKGRMQADLFAGEGKIWFSDLFSKKGQIGNLSSFVTSYDENMQPRYHYLNNTFERAQTRKYFGREHYNYTQDFDVLINSDRDRKVGRISDIVLRTELEDTDLDEDEIKGHKESLARSLPEDLKNDPQFLNFFPAGHQTNAFFSRRLVFGHEAFQSLQSWNKDNLTQKIYEFLNDHPKRKDMNLPTDTGDNMGGGLGTYSQEIAYTVADIADPRVSNEDSLKAFERAQKYHVFEKYLVGEFFPSILPKGSSSSLFGLDLKITSREIGQPVPVHLGERKVSPVYEAVSFFKAIISDPSLDMQMVGSTDHTGSTIYTPAKGSAVSLPARLEVTGSQQQNLQAPTLPAPTGQTAIIQP